MDSQTTLNAVIDFIEENLTSGKDDKAIANIAGCSMYNLDRVFSMIWGLTVTDYIRRRKMTLAMEDVIKSERRVIDIANKYGYDNPVSFTRAFKEFHGVTPKEARAGSGTAKIYPKIVLQIKNIGDNEMTVHIEKQNAFQVFGLEGSFKTENGAQDLWKKNYENGEYDKLAAAAGDLPSFITSRGVKKVHGIHDYKCNEMLDFFNTPYMQFAFKSENSKSEGYAVADIPAYTWAIIRAEVSKQDETTDIIRSIFKYFLFEWLPNHGYEKDVEVTNIQSISQEAKDALFNQYGWEYDEDITYDLRDIMLEVYGGSADKGYIELWFPVKERDAQASVQ